MDLVSNRWYWSPSLGEEDVSNGLIEVDGKIVYQSIRGEWRLLPHGLLADAILPVLGEVRTNQ
jgi:hypothetical protein